MANKEKNYEKIQKILEKEKKALTAAEIREKAKSHGITISSSVNIGDIANKKPDLFYKFDTDDGMRYGLVSFLEEAISSVLNVGGKGKPPKKDLEEIYKAAPEDLKNKASDNDEVKSSLQNALDNLAKNGVIVLDNGKYVRKSGDSTADEPDPSAPVDNSTGKTKKAKKSDEKEKNQQVEAKLHKLLSSFVAKDSRFQCYTRTISANAVNNEIKGEKEWLNPDIVGVQFPFGELAKNSTNNLSESITELMSQTGSSAIKLFSFELKVNVDFVNLKQYYFQAVSNSSWANEGYLVALKFAESRPENNERLFAEMQRLSQAFGIGFIELVPYSIKNSKILFPARAKDELDWFTINTLYGNPDKKSGNSNFQKFIDKVVEVKGNKSTLKGIASDFQDFFKDQEEIDTYIDRDENADLRSKLQELGIQKPAKN